MQGSQVVKATTTYDLRDKSTTDELKVTNLSREQIGKNNRDRKITGTDGNQ